MGFQRDRFYALTDERQACLQMRMEIDAGCVGGHGCRAQREGGAFDEMPIEPLRAAGEATGISTR